MDNFYVKAETQERWNELLEIFEEAGVRWKGGASIKIFHIEVWNYFKTDSVIKLINKHIIPDSFHSDMKEVKFENLREVLGLEDKLVEVEIGIDKEYISRNCKLTWKYGNDYLKEWEYSSIFIYQPGINLQLDFSNSVIDDTIHFNKVGDIIKQFGFKLVEPKPKQIELTMDEIAEKFGISVDNLKIKK